jgi:hypothetical protein
MLKKQGICHLPLVDLDIQDGLEEDIEVDIFLDGQNIPLNRILGSTIVKAIKHHEDFPT